MTAIEEVASFLEFLGEPILIINESSKIAFVNPACAELFGYQRDKMQHLQIEDLVAESKNLNHSALTKDYIHNQLPPRDMTGRSLVKCVNSEGKVFETRISIASAKIDNQFYGVAILQDYTSIQKIISDLESESNIDVLTNLFNRRYLQSILKENSRIQTLWDSIGVLYLDLNKFKPVNDDLGHSVGDEILKVVANRLKDTVRFDDVVLRIGGDEFIILLNLSGIPDKLVTLRNISNNICSLISEPIYLSHTTVNIAVSIGAGIYPEHKNNLTELIQAADKAMYTSKNNDLSVTFVNQLPNHNIEMTPILQ
ncbi:sensor domain-containing diguanylate cyclase [Pseudomonadota bacterium]|nr:sensor domain-containing diguanylate cyclase [Pseudomonadota bacterium]